MEVFTGTPYVCLNEIRILHPYFQSHVVASLTSEDIESLGFFVVPETFAGVMVMVLSCSKVLLSRFATIFRVDQNGVVQFTVALLLCVLLALVV